MPVHVIHDPMSDPPRPLEWRFELAARRIAETWLATREIVASLDDLRLATPFLRHLGLTVEPLPGLEVRLVSEGGGATVMSREAAILTAIRHLAALGAQRSARTVARAA